MTQPKIWSPATTVDAPPAPEPATGLISLAQQPDASDPRWIGGYTYSPELPSRTARTRSMITDSVGQNVGSAEQSASVSTIPVLLTAEDQHSGFVQTSEDWVARITRILEMYSSKLLERELWLGEIARQDGLPNRVLATNETRVITPSSGPIAPQKAVSLLVGALGDAGMGGVMIHAPKRIGLQLPDGWRNEQTFSDFGFVVVAGTGYPGTGPDGNGDNWLYATEMVNVRLGDVEASEVRFDRTTNTSYMYAERVGAADFAGPVLACQVQ